MLISIHPQNPEERKLRQVASILANGGLVIYPTDTVYAIGCDMTQKNAVEKLCKLKGIKPEKANFAIICYDLSSATPFTKPISNEVYKMMRRNLPGPFTFILQASNEVPKIMDNNKKTIGIRIPDNNIARQLVQMLGLPIITTSLKYDETEFLEYPTDPEEIHEHFGHMVDVVIDGGPCGNTASTVVDCTLPSPEVTREGAGILL